MQGKVCDSPLECNVQEDGVCDEMSGGCIYEERCCSLHVNSKCLSSVEQVLVATGVFCMHGALPDSQSQVLALGCCATRNDSRYCCVQNKPHGESCGSSTGCDEVCLCTCRTTNTE